MTTQTTASQIIKILNDCDKHIIKARKNCTMTNEENTKLTTIKNESQNLYNLLTSKELYPIYKQKIEAQMDLYDKLLKKFSSDTALVNMQYYQYPTTHYNNNEKNVIAAMETVAIIKGKLNELVYLKKLIEISLWETYKPYFGNKDLFNLKKIDTAAEKAIELYNKMDSHLSYLKTVLEPEIFTKMEIREQLLDHEKRKISDELNEFERLINQGTYHYANYA